MKISADETRDIVGSFRNNEKREAFIVDKNNPKYSSQNGCLFNKDKTKILLAPAIFISVFCIPPGVKAIGAFCFKDMYIQTLILPDTVKNIEPCAFMNTRIEMIDLNQTSKLGAGAFWNCKYLREITAYHLKAFDTRVVKNCTALCAVKLGKQTEIIKNDEYQVLEKDDYYVVVRTK